MTWQPVRTLTEADLAALADAVAEGVERGIRASRKRAPREREPRRSTATDLDRANAIRIARSIGMVGKRG